MSKNKSVFLGVLGAVFVLVLAGVFLLNRPIPTFSGYGDNAVLGELNPPEPAVQEKNYVSNPNGESLLSVGSLQLSGIENVADLNAKSDTTGKLECSFQSVQGAFKLILVSGSGKVTPIFDSEKQKSGSVVSVPFSKGTNAVRLVGKPVMLTGFSAKWAEIDRSELA